MLDFSTIANDVQIKVAEKMSFFVQAEFEISSKCGRDVMNSFQHKAVVEIPCIEIDIVSKRNRNVRQRVIKLEVDMENGSYVLKNWNVIRQQKYLPRFKVDRLRVLEQFRIEDLLELGEKLDLYDSNVHLYWRRFDLTVSIFEKLDEIFNITAITVYERDDLCPGLFSLPKFREMNFLEVPITKIPEPILLELKAPRLIFTDYSEHRSNVVTDLFLEEWFQKERDIAWFKIEKVQFFRIDKEDVIRRFQKEDLELIWRGRGEEVLITSEITFLDTKDTTRKYDLHDDDVIYSLNRGDKKLLIFLSETDDLIIAQEHTDLDDIVQIKETKWRCLKRRRSQSPDSY